MHAIAVVESTHVAEVRREASQEATSLSFDATATGRVALVATELATNVLKHGGGGEVLIGSYDDVGGNGVELIALDKGRGIADLQTCFRDGHSSAGSAGKGLGAIRRQSQLMEVASWPGVGTAVLARLGAQTASQAASAPAVLPTWFGSICVPLRGEQVCGDAVMCAETPAGRTMIVADGLGHGPEAARAALETIRLFLQHQSRPLPELLEFIHAGLRSTRGAAVAVSRFALDGSKVTFGGIGNIGGVTIGPSGLKRMVSLSGTAGHVARRIQVFDYPYSGGAVVMHSDGLGSHWSLDRYPGLQQAHPSLVAAVLYRDFTRGRDDVAVLVGRGQESS